MIEIICDQYEFHASEDCDNLITEPFEFEGTLEIIKRHAEKGESLKIVVRNPALFDWFDAACKYGAKKQIIDPVIMLADKLELQVMPEYLKNNPHWVVELGLIKKCEGTPIHGTSADNWLKRIMIGEVWTKNEPSSTTDLIRIFKFLIKTSESDLHELEKYLISDCLICWSNNKLDSAELFSWLKDNPFTRAKYIIWEQLLSLFPEDKISAWLQQDNVWYELTLFLNRHKLPRFDLLTQLPESITSFARSFLDEEWRISPENALSFISGTMEFEKIFLMEKLRKRLHDEVAINNFIYTKLLEFKNFSGVTALAHQLHPVNKPTELSMDCSIHDIQKWLDNEYLPFYNSCALLGMVDQTEPYIKSFESWLAQHYTDMLFGKGMAYSKIAQLKELVTAGEPVLMIVFDGLDYICARDELIPMLQNNGFYPSTDMVPYFSFLPTQTYIAKPTLVTGKMKSQIPDEQPNATFYKKLLQDYLGIPENDIRSKTDRDGSLLELIQEPAAVYLYLDNHLDQELLHRNYRQYIRRKKYGEYIQKQANEIAQCLKDFKEMYGKSLQVIISSDHGYTVIPKTSEIIDVPLTKSGKTRTLIAAEIEKQKEIEQDKIWELNSDLYGLNDTMIIPKGYACFNKRPKGATHGGCSPQEMAVPWFIINKNKPVPPIELNFTIEGDIFRKRAENSLTITILNPNPYKVIFVEMDIEGMDTNSNLPKMINANTIEKIYFNYDASVVVENNAKFPISYCFNSMAGEMKNKLTITAPTTGAMTTEFDDDFDF